MAVTIATGGTVTTSGAYTIHTFTSSGTFTINYPVAVEYLVVAGGGGGGGVIGGGGGGGGVRTGTLTMTAGAKTVTIGAGGAGGRGWNNYPQRGDQGGNSVFDSITATGGGGGSAHGGADTRPATTGGSGGGGGAAGTAGAAGTVGQGYAGGAGSGDDGGGGGGAAAAGTDYGNGGIGVYSSISGTGTRYGGGGGGGGRNGVGSAGTGGTGGGGNGSLVDSYKGAIDGTANTGGGGGGAGHDGGGSGYVGGNGGSGIVIVRYFTPVEITTWAGLDDVRDNLAGNYFLANDLGTGDTGYDTYASSSANSGAGWDPIATNGTNYFTGTFNGQNHTIDGLCVNTHVNGTGLFGATASPANISNLGLTNVNISVESDYVGALVGIGSNTTITNCYSTGSVASTTAKVGGLIGRMSTVSQIRNCFSTCSVMGDDDVGGFIGDNNASIYDSYATGSVTETDEYQDGYGLGGFCGSSSSNIYRCYSTGLVTAGDTVDVGGFLGADDGGIVDSCFWNTETSGQATDPLAVGVTTAEMKDINTYRGSSIDGADFTGTDDDWPLYSAEGEAGSQITGDGRTIAAARFYIKKAGSPTGNVVAKVYATSGGVPDGAALATSDNVDVSTLSTSYGYVNFTFSGGNQISLTRGTTYAVVVSYTGGDDFNRVDLSLDSFEMENSFLYLGGLVWNEDPFISIAFAIGTDTNFTAPRKSWDIVENASWTTETWKIVDGKTYPRLGWETIRLAKKNLLLTGVG